MKKWRVVEFGWNLNASPWRGGYGIEEDDDEVAVPSLVCWFYRGYDKSVVQRVVDLHNRM